MAGRGEEEEGIIMVRGRSRRRYRITEVRGKRRTSESGCKRGVEEEESKKGDGAEQKF